MDGGHKMPLRPCSTNCCLVFVCTMPSLVRCPLTEAVSDLQTISGVGSFSSSRKDSFTSSGNSILGESINWWCLCQWS